MYMRRTLTGTPDDLYDPGTFFHMYLLYSDP